MKYLGRYWGTADEVDGSLTTEAAGQELRYCERLIEIGNDVVDVLNSDGKSNVAFGDASPRLLLGCELRMCRTGGVNGERTGVADIRDVIEHLEAVNEFETGIAAASKLEADQATVAALQMCVGAALRLASHQAREASKMPNA
jgi:hypothetical protein